MQETALRSLPDIVVATPGRMIDHLRNSMSVHLDELAILILDEADRLLELGFSKEIRELVIAQLFTYCLRTSVWLLLGFLLDFGFLAQNFTVFTIFTSLLVLPGC